MKRKAEFQPEVHFSSNKEDWETPQHLFNQLNDKFHFDIDVAADSKNAKLQNYFSKTDDALKQIWHGNVFCNPPYKRGGMMRKWVKKAYEEHQRDPNRVIVLLIPARTETTYFHDFIFDKAKVEFLRGRLKFESNGVPYPHNAPFPSVVVIYGNDKEETK